MFSTHQDNKPVYSTSFPGVAPHAPLLLNYHATTPQQNHRGRNPADGSRKGENYSTQHSGLVVFYAGLCCIRYYSLPQSSGNDTPLCARIYPQFWLTFFVAFLRGYTFIRGFLFIFCSDFCPPNFFRS